MLIISIAIIIIIIISIIIITITVITILHGRCFKSDNYLLQFLCYMTSDVKLSYFAHVLLFTLSLFKSFYELKWLGLFDKCWYLLKSNLFKKRSFDRNETTSKYAQINIFTGKRLWWRPFKYSCVYEGLQLYEKRLHQRCFLVKLVRFYRT